MHHDSEHHRHSQPRTRKEWTRDSEHEHPVRKHARAPGKLRRKHGVREQEAERQIRELRARH